MLQTLLQMFHHAGHQASVVCLSLMPLSGVLPGLEGGSHPAPEAQRAVHVDVTFQGSGEATSDAWVTRALAGIRAREYTYSVASNGGWSAPNRSQGLRSRVLNGALEVVSREIDANAGGAAWSVELRTVAFGRVGAVMPTECSGVTVKGARVELEHGVLQEWIVNDARGIEQGWTIEERPAGDEPLVLTLAIDGGLSLHVDEDGTSGVFMDAGGRARAKYGDLAAWDATGRALSVRMSAVAQFVELLVEDDGAVYPVVVDPLLSNAVWNVVSGQAGDAFGSSLHGAGDVNGDGYDDVIIGAPGYDNGEVDEGRVFVYHGSASGLGATAAWTAESDVAGLYFGGTVSGAGDVNGDGYDDVIISARYYTNGVPEEGAVWVYHGSPTGLGQAADWFFESGASFSEFGSALASAGDVNGDGYSDVIIGAPAVFTSASGLNGAAYGFYGSATGLGPTPDWFVVPDNVTAVSNSGFGRVVSMAGDVNGDGYDDVIVGAPFYQFMPFTRPGRAFVYHGSATGLGTAEAWSAGTLEHHAWFGSSVSTAGDVNGDGFSDVIVGSKEPLNGHLVGNASVYYGSVSGLGAAAAWSVDTNEESLGMAAFVSNAGDVNGDGYSDVIAGPTLNSVPAPEEGAASVYFGSPVGLRANDFWRLTEGYAGWQIPWGFADAGDVDGDGYDDFIVGAVATSSTAVFVFHGGASLVPIGMTFCVAGPNSVGPGAELRARGSAIVACNSFTLICDDAPAGVTGLFSFGPTQIQVPFGEGFSCVGGAVERLWPPVSVNAQGGASRVVDLAEVPALGIIIPGANLNFQFWYRDRTGGPSGFNLSNGLNIVWQ